MRPNACFRPAVSDDVGLSDDQSTDTESHPGLPNYLVGRGDAGCGEKRRDSRLSRGEK
jgi:hypothetical protein